MLRPKLLSISRAHVSKTLERFVFRHLGDGCKLPAVHGLQAVCRSGSFSTSLGEVMQSARVNLSRCLKNASRAPLSANRSRQQESRDKAHLAVPRAAAVHAWTAGAIGLMTLAVMTRASNGHAGPPLTASNLVAGIYVSAAIGAAARILAAFGGEPFSTVTITALGWTLAFLTFVSAFAPLLTIRAP
jgi:hypothetical protein